MTPIDHARLIEALRHERHRYGDWPDLYLFALLSSRGVPDCGLKSALISSARDRLQLWGRQGRITQKMWGDFAQAVFRELVEMRLEFEVYPHWECPNAR